MLMIDGIYDGKVVHLLSSPSLSPNTRVKVIIEESEETPKLGENYSFLKVALRMKQQGPTNFSENIHEYLNADKLDHHDE